MTVLEVVFVVVVALTLAVGATVGARVHAPGGGPRRWGPALAARFGAVPAAVGVAVLGWLVTLVVLAPLGLASRASARHLDEPVFRWVHRHAEGPGSSFGKTMQTLTLMGNRPFIEVVTLAALIVLAMAYGRRWWIPVVAVAVAVVLQREGQNVLGDLVHRSAPPALDSGVFPSGGVSRLLAVLGIMAVLAVLLIRDADQQRRWRVRAVNGIVLFSVIEAYTRVYTSTHWFTDAITGLIFGALLLLVETTFLYALLGTGPRPPTADEPRDPPARAEAGTSA